MPLAARATSTFFRLSAPFLLEIFLYGLYTTLLFICTYILVKSKNIRHVPYLLAAIVMYAVATADIALNLHRIVDPGDMGNSPFPDMGFGVLNFALFLSNGIIADGLLIYRLYVIWDFRKRVVIGPLVLLVTKIAISIHFKNLRTTVLPFLALALSIIFTAILAGRIWWVARKGSQILGPGVIRRYNIAVAIMVESGAICTAYTMLYIFIDSYTLNAGLVQMAGIMPTLIIVRVGLGREVHNLQTGVKDTGESDITTPQESQVLDIRANGSSETRLSV